MRKTKAISRADLKVKAQKLDIRKLLFLIKILNEILTKSLLVKLTNK